MIDPTSALSSGPCGMLLPADTPNTMPTGEGTGFASALAQAGASPSDPAAADGSAAAAIAQTAPIAPDLAVDALQPSPAADPATPPLLDVQALEASFESLAGLAHQLTGRAETSDPADTARNTRPTALNTVDSAIAALVDALQFAPQPDAAVSAIAVDASALPPTIDDGVLVLADDEGDEGDEAGEPIDPLVGSMPAPLPMPAAALTAPTARLPRLADALPGNADPALAPVAERKGALADARASGKATPAAGRDRPTLAAADAADTGAGASAGRAPAAGSEATARGEAAPRVSEPTVAPSAARPAAESPFQALFSAASPTSSSNASQAASPAPFQAQLSAAIDSPNFGAALGVQISTLADNGISEARLHLNPAELGPIAVQIGLDGTLAQVHLAVEHSSTRQALEQALPELAAALRDAGFTMTGGGVSQQTREQQQQAAATAVPGRLAATTDDALATLAAPVRTTRRGMLDVYA